MPWLVTLGLILVAWLAPTGPAQAGTISLGTTVAASVVDGILRVEVSLLNQGDEAAHDLTLSLTADGERVQTPGPSSLPPQQPWRTVLDLPLNPTLAGTYPALVGVVFHDRNGHAFSSLAHVLFDLGVCAPSRVSARGLPGRVAGDGEIRFELTNADQTAHPISLRLAAPQELTLDQPRQVLVLPPQSTRELRVTVRNLAALAGASYPVLLLLEYDHDGRHHSAVGVAPVTVENPPDLVGAAVPFLYALAGLLLVAMVCLQLRARHAPGPDPMAHHRASRWPQAVVDLAVLLGCWGLLLCYFPPSLLLLDTITTGGDTGSHFLTADYLVHQLLPQGRVVGWFPGNLAGFPLFQFYFPLPFLIMAGLHHLGLPLTIAFKLVSAAGAFLIPPAAYLGLRLAGRPFPAPALAAAFSLLFLCNETNSMWGGNLPSLLAGEIGYSIGLGLLMVYLGAVQGDIDRRRHPIRNALLLALVGLAHGCTLLFAVLAGFIWLFHHDLVRRGAHLLKIYALSFCLLGFWIVPLILFAGYNTTHNMVWIIERWQEALPPILAPLMVLCLVHLAWGVTRWLKGRAGLGGAGLHLGFIALSLVLYLAAFHLNVIDIRFLPLAWLALVPWAALAGADFSRALTGRILTPLLGLALCLLWVAHWVEYIPKWAQWNYRGYELAQGWPDFKRLNDYLQGGLGDPRVLHEHADRLQSLGTTRAFENLMLFCGRAGMEGLYIQSSLNSPFVYYLQSQTSQTPTTPLPGINYSRFDLAAAHDRMVLYNVGQFVAVTDATRQAAEVSPGYRLETRIGPFSVFRVEGNPGHYVTPVAYKPVLVVGDDWKHHAFQWFRRGDFAVPLVFQDRERPGDRQRFAAVVRELPPELPRVALPPAPEARETIGPDRIEIQASGRGPLLIKVSYHPNWRVEGAERVYLAAPAFMLVYPTADRVVLTYGQTWPNYLGQALTILAGLCLLLNLPWWRGLSLAIWPRGLVLRPLETATSGLEALLARPLAWLGRHALTAGLAGCLVLAGLLGLYLHLGGKVDAGIALQRGLERFRVQDYAGAEHWFRHAATRWPYSPVIDQALNHWALCYHLRQQYPEALAIHHHLVGAYPESPAAPEALYHIGQGQRALRRLDEARQTYQAVVERFPASAWSDQARERLREMARDGK